MRTLASGETDAAVIAQAFRTIPAPGVLAGNMVVLNGSALVPPASLPVGAAATIINGVITAAVGSSALTLAVKTLAGADPSTDDPVLVIFRSATAAVGTYVARQITAALSIVVPSTATLGHASARDQQIIVYAIDNSGTVELAVATPLFDQSARLKTTTTIGAGSTSASTIYSTTGRSNLPWAPIARCVSNQTTAGTWAAVPTQIDMAPFTLPVNICRVYLNASQTGNSMNAFTKINFDTVDYDPDSIADVATNHRLQPKIPGTYLATCTVDNRGSGAGVPSQAGASGVSKNGTRIQGATYSTWDNGATREVFSQCSTLVQLNGTTDYIEGLGGALGAAGTVDFLAAGSLATTFSCVRVGP